MGTFVCVVVAGIINIAWAIFLHRVLKKSEIPPQPRLLGQVYMMALFASAIRKGAEDFWKANYQSKRC